MDFVIDRSKWRAGGGRFSDGGIGRGQTSLLNDDGFMCCLGQISLQLGYTESQIQRLEMPTALDPCPRLFDDNGLARMAQVINDGKFICDEERERELSALFAKHGHALTFTGDPVIPGKGA